MNNLTCRTPDEETTWSLLLAANSHRHGLLGVNSPYDGSPIAEVETCGEEHVSEAMRIAHQLFRDKDRWLSSYERVGILERTARLMTKEHAHLALLASREGGKPITDSLLEVTRAIDSIRLAVNVLQSDTGEVIPMESLAGTESRIAFTQREPIGVVVAVSAFNHPLNLVVHQVATAIAAGCPVIVKPSEKTPLSCLRFVQILHQAGLAREWAQVIVTDEIPVIEQLVTNNRVRFFSFVGSSRVGWMLRSKLAPGTRCSLEHGGAAPVILAEDADWERALKAIVKGGFYHAGQVCISVQRVYVPKKYAQLFAEKVAARVAELRLGDPTENRTEVGPLIRPGEVVRIHQWVQEAMKAGAVCLCGGNPRGESFYECTVLLEPPADAKVSRMEIFGPVVCIYGYEHLDEAIEAANSINFAFQGAVFSQDIEIALRVYRRMNGSAVMVNDHTAFRVDGMPFAGLGESGLGIGGIPYSIREMQIEKMLVLNSGRP